MKVRVLHTYGSQRLTGGQHIQPGEYDWEDKALFNLARYLVDNGHAEIVSGTSPTDTQDIEVVVDTVPDQQPDEPALDERDELMAALDEAGIEYDGRWGIARLQAALDEGAVG